MNHFEEWPHLLSLLKNGSLAFIDLVFSEVVLRRLQSKQEEHACVLAILFGLSRLGHTALDLKNLPLDLKLLEIESTEETSSLILKGIKTFPEKGISLLGVSAKGRFPHPEKLSIICLCEHLLYLQKNWLHESEILFHVKRLKSASPPLALSLKTLNPALNEEQKKAAESGAQYSVSLITGGPGTGKTFTASEIIRSCLASLPSDLTEKFRIILSAPTGKAVAQLEGNLSRCLENVETPKSNWAISSGTLHSILGIKSYPSDYSPPPLFADLIIVDECSMIDSKIFSQLLGAIQEGTRLILIGDKDQLPPVESGSIFADLIDLEICPTATLTECLRSENQNILQLADSIKKGNLDDLFTAEGVVWLDLKEIQPFSKTYDFIWEYCKHQFPLPLRHKPSAQEALSYLGSFILLSCMRKGPLGVDAINHFFLNQVLKLAHHEWSIFPIIITRNDPDLNLFNGDLGVLIRKTPSEFSLKKFQPEDSVVVCDRKLGFREFSALALNAFEYSYCQSVHKSQGSEYREILILAPEGSQAFGREILYTAVTRAKNKVSLAGSQKVILELIAKSSRKKSGLIYRS